MGHQRRRRGVWIAVGALAAAAGGTAIGLALVSGFAAPPGAGTRPRVPARSTGAASPPAWTSQALASAVSVLVASETERASVLALYERREGHAVWHDGDGRHTAGGRAVAELLAGLDAHGLDPREYLPGPTVARDTIAADVGLTLGALRAMHHLQRGRVEPAAVGLRLRTATEPHDVVAALAEGLDAGIPADAISRLAPPYALYARLVDALRRYRAIAAAGPWPALEAPPRSLHPGDAYAGMAALAARLRAFGDLRDEPLPAGAADAAAGYDGPVVEAVRRFQRRHGLTPDGVVGGRTLAALQVAPEARVRQITLALERLRWLPDLGTRRLVAVNIPMFRLWAWDAARDDATPTLAMDVIVGRAVRTQTPVFADAMEHVIFQPYWNVPRSILLGETLPALRRDAGYLSRQHMEVVRGQGDAAPAVPFDAGTLDGLASGTLRVRQRPGSHNALGLVKFMFPNDDAVYMHDTPATGLFARDRRDFSHGCIRVADPSALAAWVLARQREAWPAPRIAGAMRSGPPNARVVLDAPIDVVIFYLTAAVMPEDGAVYFAEDIYGHDVVLERALERRAVR